MYAKYYFVFGAISIPHPHLERGEHVIDIVVKKKNLFGARRLKNILTGLECKEACLKTSFLSVVSMMLCIHVGDRGSCGGEGIEVQQ